jgi:L-alanine-DL-glutamate epimerase-like enolase superfamily enzyme
MKIENAGVAVYRHKRETPIRNAAHSYDDGVLLVMTIWTDDDVVGWGLIGGTAAERPLETFTDLALYFAERIKGAELLDPWSLVESFAVDRKTFLYAGPHSQVLGAINVALHDARARSLGQPVWKSLGGKERSVRGYIAGGYMRESEDPIADLRAELEHNTKVLGARGVKIKIGEVRTGLEMDLRRVEATREAIGPDVALMLDANCAFSYRDDPVAEAIRYANAFEPFDPYWFEEPLWPDDVKGHCRLAQETSIPLATGENVTTFEWFVTLLDTGAIRYVNGDAAIMSGGFDSLMRVAEYAAARDATLVPHGCQELHIHPVIAAGHEESWLEIYPPRLDEMRTKIFQPPLAMGLDGIVPPPQAPGLGFELNLGLLQQYCTFQRVV